MNRSEVYEILSKELNIYRSNVNGKTYLKLYIPYCEDSTLKVNNSYIKGFNMVYICTHELVVRDKYAFLQVNIPYRDIEELEVFLLEAED